VNLKIVYIMSFNVGAQLINFSSIDCGGYRFTTTYEYLEYSGSDFLDELNFIEDIQEYFDDSKITLEHSEKHIMLTLPIPYSKKVILVQLKRPAVDKETELRIEMLKQQERIEILEKYVAELKAPPRPTGAHLNLMFEKDRGFYFDYDRYLSTEGSDEKSLDQFKEIINDYYGFGTVVETINGQKNYRSIKSTADFTYIPKYFCDLYYDLDDMLKKLQEPIDVGSECKYYFGTDEFKKLSDINLSYFSLANDNLNLLYEVQYHTVRIFDPKIVNIHPVVKLCNLSKLKTIKVGYFYIGTPKRYVKFEKKWNDNSESLKKMMLKTADGSFDRLAEIYVLAVGNFDYMFY
jgi:hypothetical protein